jgi:Bacterial capsule synthesis protein PGA_cap
MRSLFASLDLVICNLECSISQRGERTRRIRDQPFFFRAPPSVVWARRAIRVRAVSLANQPCARLPGGGTGRHDPTARSCRHRRPVRSSRGPREGLKSR